jgi:hypothetical protein
LAVALNETGEAAKTFDRPVPGLTAQKISDVRALNAQVHDELKAEHGSRCASALEGRPS